MTEEHRYSAWEYEQRRRDAKLDLVLFWTRGVWMIILLFIAIGATQGIFYYLQSDLEVRWMDNRPRYMGYMGRLAGVQSFLQTWELFLIGWGAAELEVTLWRRGHGGNERKNEPEPARKGLIGAAVLAFSIVILFIKTPRNFHDPAILLAYRLATVGIVLGVLLVSYVVELLVGRKKYYPFGEVPRAHSTALSALLIFSLALYILLIVNVLPGDL